jgi:hypothetical protein
MLDDVHHDYKAGVARCDLAPKAEEFARDGLVAVGWIARIDAYCSGRSGAFKHRPREISGTGADIKNATGRQALRDAEQRLELCAIIPVRLDRIAEQMFFF